jgi:hypothetical protein
MVSKVTLYLPVFWDRFTLPTCGFTSDTLLSTCVLGTSSPCLSMISKVIFYLPQTIGDFSLCYSVIFEITRRQIEPAPKSQVDKVSILNHVGKVLHLKP